MSHVNYFGEIRPIGNLQLNNPSLPAWQQNAQEITANKNLKDVPTISIISKPKGKSDLFQKALGNPVANTQLNKVSGLSDQVNLQHRSGEILGSWYAVGNNNIPLLQQIKRRKRQEPNINQISDQILGNPTSKEIPGILRRDRRDAATSTDALRNPDSQYLL